jgi:UDP-glucuronate decarboxylase
VDDLVDALVRLMSTPDDVTGPMNLGNPGEFTILQLAEMVISLTGSRSSIKRMPLPSDDPRQRQPDLALAKATLDWQPTTPLREGLQKTIAYFERLLSSSSQRASATGRS